MGRMLEPTTRPKIVQDVGEEPLVLYSDVRGPLAGLSFLRRSLALAELALIAYNDAAEAAWAALAIGFPDARLIERDGSQVYRFANRHDVVFACRGTEPTEWNDIQADANAALAVVGTLGRVHSGFNREVEDVWPVLGPLLARSKQPAWFCGHSLGAAMATICAVRCRTEGIAANQQELHTFGSPRVGCRRWKRHASASHYRWVHNNDIVTRVPPRWWGYRHCGREMYLDRFGQLRDLTGIWRSRDRWRGLWAGLLRWEIDWLADHSIKHYARHLCAAADQAESSVGKDTMIPQRRAA
jgi:triacylglycerol lipase